jgi:Polymerase beta, Nucleotidyltransferase
MTEPQAEPAWLAGLCERIASRLAGVDGVKAVALGGSRARRTVREDSDIDLGLYYDASTSLPLEQIDDAARDLDDRHLLGLVTPLGAWGPGVNGGGWLQIDGRQVDILYRDLGRVREVVERCVRGQIEAFYQLGHPIGFQSQIYAGEIHFCRPLNDPADELKALKVLVAKYPSEMRRALVGKHLFDVQFETELAFAPAGRGDLVYVSQCLSRATGFAVLVLYAINERFFLNEKNAFIESASFPLRPENFHREVGAILRAFGSSAVELTHSVTRMRGVIEELRGFALRNCRRRSCRIQVESEANIANALRRGRKP